MPPVSSSEEEIFHAARRIGSATERRAYLDQTCRGDVALRKQVEALLAAYEASNSFLESPAAEIAAEIPTRDGPMGESTNLIGPYKLLQQIGEGGMGVVFMAEQSHPVQRRVAIKIIKPGSDTRQVIARFEAERQTLAMMDHPHIARMLDAGTTASGRPYFVMDLVKGVPITTFCDEKQLSVPERLRLVSQVCHAVQHAHQKGVIHRDLKPSNVLVAEYDDRPIPKIIDFGVAKVTAHSFTERTLFTQFGQIVGTCEYMSPEQAKFNQLDVDTRSDIYSLGVLLYELLTGTTPFDRGRLREAALDEVLRIIREEEPLSPSTRLSSIDTLASIATSRHTEPARLSRDLRGELDWIVMKALEKDRNRRYATASALAADIERHLSDQPVEAGPPSGAYRFRKFAKRHKSVLLAGSVIAAALVFGLVGTTWQASRAVRAEYLAKEESKRASQEEAKAKTEAAIATAINRFLTEDLLSQANPNRELDRDIRLRTVLDRAAAKIDGRFPDQPLVEAAIRSALAGTFIGLGEWPEAQRHSKRAWELYDGELGHEHPVTLNSAAALAEILYFRSESERDAQLGEQARLLIEPTLAAQRRILGDKHADTVGSVNVLANLLASRDPAECIVFLDRWLPMVRKDYPESHKLNNLIIAQANSLRELGRKEEALQRYLQALENSKRVSGAEHPRTLLLEDNVAISLQGMERMQEALQYHLRVVDCRRRILGEGNAYTIWSIPWMWGDIRGLARAPEGAAGAVKHVQGIIESAPHSGAAWTALGLAHYEAGDWNSAIASWKNSMQVRKGESCIDWFLLSMAHSRLGDKDTARQFYDRAMQWINTNQIKHESLDHFRDPAEELLKIVEAPATTKQE